MKITKIGNQTLWRALCAVFILVLILGVAGDVVTKSWSGYINAVLGVSNTTIVNDPNAEAVDTDYYKSDYTSPTELKQNAVKAAKEIQAEGTVLLTNKNNALPLAKNSKVTYLSYGMVDPIICRGIKDVDLIDANKGKLDANMTAYNFYKSKLDSDYMASKGKLIRKTGGGFGAGSPPANASLPEIPASEFPTEMVESFNTYKDAAIFVYTRNASEGSDLVFVDETVKNGKYLALSDEERTILEMMKNGPFSKRIVMVNASNVPELGWLDEYNIDACIYTNGVGGYGFDSVIDIMVGDINPSGKTNDTFAYSAYSAPAMENLGAFRYTNENEIGTDFAKNYIAYAEGIYVGYRYYETRYEDSVLNRGNARSDAGVKTGNSSWNYAKEVQFPFGYGISYSTFTQTLDKVTVDEKAQKATVEVTVKNTGSREGKDVVEVYAQAPYTPGGVEKSAIQLVGFAKTAALKAGGSETVTVEVDLADLASYDKKEYKTYIMDKGDYYFAIGNGAHEALNNVLALKGKKVADGMDVEGNAANAYKWVKKNFDKDEYSLSKTLKKITNQFDDADLNYYMPGALTYLSRNDWKGTYPKALTGLTANKQMVDEMNSYYTTDSVTPPKAYTPGSTDTSAFTQGAEQKYSLVMMRGVDYEDPAWQEILNQLTLKELCDLSRQGRAGALSINLPETTATDSPQCWGTGVRYKEKWNDYSKDAKKTDITCVSYPCGTVIANTWNLEMAKKKGNFMAEEGLWGAGVGWYGPAANIHRTPASGRNNEYYSEDGFISGLMCEAEMEAAQAKGEICYIKHVFLNDAEINREQLCTFADEQAMREVYLKAFQRPCEINGNGDRGARGVMGAFNRLGLIWTGHHSRLWQNVLRGEWGYTGNITTDFGQSPEAYMEPRLAYEAGTTMFCSSNVIFTNYLLATIEKDAKLMENVREADHRILYNFANSAAMNGLSTTSRVVHIMTWYNKAFLSIIIISAVLAAASIAMLVLHIIYGKKEGRE